MYYRRFIIAYHPADRTRWWNWMLKKGYGHVEVYTDIAGGFMLLYPNFIGIALYEQYCTEEELLKLDNMVFQEYIVNQRESQKSNLKGIITCVSIVKNLLFINKWWIITPFQLYKYIERYNHGKSIQNTKES